MTTPTTLTAATKLNGLNMNDLPEGIKEMAESLLNFDGSVNTDSPVLKHLRELSPEANIALKTAEADGKLGLNEVVTIIGLTTEDKLSGITISSEARHLADAIVDYANVTDPDGSITKSVAQIVEYDLSRPTIDAFLEPVTPTTEDGAIYGESFSNLTKGLLTAGFSRQLVETIPHDGLDISDGVKKIVTDKLGSHADGLVDVNVLKTLVERKLEEIGITNAQAFMSDGIIERNEAIAMLAELGNEKASDIQPSPETLDAARSLARDYGLDDEKAIVGIARLDTLSSHISAELTDLVEMHMGTGAFLPQGIAASPDAVLDTPSFKTEESPPKFQGFIP